MPEVKYYKTWITDDYTVWEADCTMKYCLKEPEALYDFITGSQKPVQMCIRDRRKRGERRSAERKKDAVKGFPDLEEGQAPCREICHGIEKHACTGTVSYTHLSNV